MPKTPMMTCTVCRHPKRKAIDKALIAGDPEYSIANRFAVSRDAVHRHKAKGHAGIRRAMERVRAKREAENDRQADEVAARVETDSLVVQLRKLIAEAQSIAKEARRTRNLSVAMSGIDRQARVLELIARLTGELDESTRVNVLIAQRQAAEAGQVTEDLAKLTVEERIQLEALLTKARGPKAVEVLVGSSVLVAPEASISVTETVTQP